MRRAIWVATALLITAAMPASDSHSLAAGSLLVLNKSADTLVFVDPEKLEVVATIPTGHAPHEVAVDRAGTTAYVANYGTGPDPGNTLTVVDLTARKPAGIIDLGELKRPHGIVVAPDGMVWVTCEGSQAVAVVDPKERKVIRSFKTAQEVTHMVVLTSNGKRAFTANIGSDTVTMIDAASGEVTHIVVGKGPEGIDITPDGKEVWVAHRGDGGVSIIDTGTGRVVHKLEKVGAMPIRIKFTPDGRRALISCAQGGEVAIYDTRERREFGRIKTGEVPIGLLVLPGGRKAFVANTQADKVTLLDLEKGVVAGSVAPGREPDGLGWAGPASR